MIKGIPLVAAALGLLIIPPGQQPPAGVETLDASAEPLRSAFNDAAGATRLIALVAPT